MSEYQKSEHQTNRVLEMGMKRAGFVSKHNTHFVNDMEFYEKEIHKEFLKLNARLYELKFKLDFHRKSMSEDELHNVDGERILLQPEIDKIVGILSLSAAVMSMFTEPGWYCFYCGYLEPEDVSYDETCALCGAVLPT